MIIGNNVGIGYNTKQDQAKYTQPISHTTNVVGISNSGQKAIDIMGNSIIEKFIVIETKPFKQDIYNRSYNLNMSSEKRIKVENLLDRAQCMHGGKITEEMIGRDIPNIMEFNTISGNKVNIVNGWNQSRFRFFLKIKQQGINNMCYYIQGYTDYLDNTMLRGLLDENNLVFYINSIIETIENDNSLYLTSQRIIRNINVLNNGANVIFQDVNSQSKNRIARPEDIYSVMANNKANEGFQSFDFTSVMTNKAVSSFKINNDGVKHFTKMLNAVIGAKLNVDDSYLQHEDILRKANNNVHEAKLNDISFIKALSSLYSTSPVVTFTITDLIKIFKERFIEPTVIIDNNIRVNENIMAMGFCVGIDSRVMDSSNSHELYDTSIETSIAYSLHNKLVTYMSEMKLGKLTVTMSNMNISNETHVEAFGNSLIETCIDIDFIQKLETIKYKCKNVLFNEISKNKERSMSVLVNMDWLGKTTIAIDINNGLGGDNLKTYSFPTYADSLYSPIVYEDNSFNTLVNDYTNIIETIYLI